MFLLYSWGSLFGVLNKIPVVKIPEAKPMMSLLSLLFYGVRKGAHFGRNSFLVVRESLGWCGGRGEIVAIVIINNNNCCSMYSNINK